MKYTLLASCLFGLIAQVAVSAEDHTAQRPSEPSAALALIHDDRLSRLELDVAIGGASLEDIWNSTFDALFQFADANVNGQLETSELALLPSPQALRHALGSGFAPPIGWPVSPEDLRGGANGRITRQQVAEYYRQHGIGTVSFGLGELKSTPVLTQALLEALDGDQDGSVSEADWASAAETLMKLDTNDDELVGAGEIVPHMLYPGAAGTMLLQPSTNGSSHIKWRSAAPVVSLSADPSDERWIEEINSRGVNASTDKLRRWRQEEAAAHWKIHFDVGESTSNSLAWSSHKQRLQCWLVAGSLAEPNRFVREHVTKALRAGAAASASSNAGREQSVDWLIPLADRDRDGEVSHAEAEQWFSLQASIVRGQVLVTILWGGGLFEILDRNHDGALATRELRSVRQVLSEAGCVTDGRVDVGAVPRVMLVIASRGYPETLAQLRLSRPGWAQAMDRNADGDISRREFSGPVEAFQRMDLDRDGLVDAREAVLQSPRGR